MSPPNEVPKDATPEPVSGVKTTDLLRDLGFVEDHSLISDPMPGLTFDFGNFKLSAVSGANRHFTRVILLTGVMTTKRRLCEVECEMPLKVESIEQGKAWVTWCLDGAAGGTFKPVPAPSWLAEGRQYFHLLPWKRGLAAYNVRPHCNVDREWARVALKTLGEQLKTVDDEARVTFGFDGAVLTICCAGKVIAMPADGLPWAQGCSIRAGLLKENLPKRLKHTVEVSVWKAMLTINNRGYRPVVAIDVEGGK